MDWPTIIEEHGAVVLRISARILGGGPDAEDVAQEAFLDGYRIWQSSKVGNWAGLLRKIATRRAIDVLRRRLEPLPPGHEPVSPAPSPQDEMSATELKNLIRHELSRLPARQAEVFAMRYFEDLSNQEIAETLGVSVSSVSTALTKARTQLAGKLAHIRCGDVT